MSEAYPPPLSSLLISLCPAGVNVHIPPSHHGGKGHSIVVPATEAGWVTVVAILRERANGHLRLGTPGAPAQRQICDPRVLAGFSNALARNEQAKREAAQTKELERNAKRAAIDELLRDLDL